MPLTRSCPSPFGALHTVFAFIGRPIIWLAKSFLSRLWFQPGLSQLSNQVSHRRQESGASARPPACTSTPALKVTEQPERTNALVELLVSPSVQLQSAVEVTEEPKKLTTEKVEEIFVDRVPGVKKFVFREQHGVYSLKFIAGAYENGFNAFNGTDLHGPLMWHLRYIVHQAEADKPGINTPLREVAEAFMDCQAVQARVVEKVSLQLRGVSHDFRQHAVQLVDEYKLTAVKMLTYTHVVALGGPDSYNDPPHYENRLINDVGAQIGLSEADVYRAGLDGHANQRFPRLDQEQQLEAVKDLRRLFDLPALLRALAAEVSTFSAASDNESCARQFLDWVGKHMVHKHIVFDEDTCSRVEVDDALVLAVLEVLFTGKPNCPPDERYRDELVIDLFQ